MDLSKIKSCIKLTGYVNSTDTFTDQPKVINGASDTIVKIFGQSGMHARAAISSNSLPLGVSVEVDAIFELNWSTSYTVIFDFAFVNFIFWKNISHIKDSNIIKFG